VNSRQDQITELRAAIAAQESMRSTLGDATVELSLKPLRSLLESLLAQEAPSPQSESALQEQALLAQLQSYIPRQLAEKLRSSGHIEGERRQATVVFADISGFTALVERLDPEVVASFLNDCMKEMIDAVYQCEGMVNQIIGDCVMAVFGAPIALEDDAERALRAALAMRERLEAINKRWLDQLKEPLALHTGISSGMIVATNVGSDFRMSYHIIGDSVNVASRLQGVATSGQIVVSQSTYRLTRGAFDFRPLEPVRVKGKTDSLAVFELIEAKSQPGKIRGLEGLISPLVGRGWERKVITKAIAATKSGRGAMVLVSGDAGVGKSRLLEEIQSGDFANFAWLEGRCFASTQTLSYAPILDLLRRQIQIADKQGIEEQQAALRHYVTDNFQNKPQVYSILAQVLALPLAEADSELIKALTGEEFRTQFFAIVEQRLLSLAEKQPLVLVIEDLHWADESSIDLLAYVLPLIKRTRFSFIGLSRSRQRPENLWNKLAPVLEECRENLVEVPLQSLSVEESRTLMKHLLGGDYLPESVVTEILDKSEGNPFFLEEVLRSLIERGGLVLEEKRWMATPLTGTLQVPDTLQGVLLSRLDRLSVELKQVTQKAAVIGRIFYYRVLERLTNTSNSLRDQLASLEALDLVHEGCRLPELEFIFKHALTQEVAYQTLLTPARKELHRQVGDALELLFRDRLDEFAGVLAYHFFSAEYWQKALEYSIRSGDAAFRVCAYAEARDHYGRALKCLKYLEDDPEHLRSKVEITIGLVGASLHAGAPEENLAMLVEAEEIAQSLNDLVLVARVQLWIGRAHYIGGRLKEAAGYYQKAIYLALQLEDPELVALPKAVFGRVLIMQGRFQESLQMLNQAIPILERERNQHETLFAYIHRGIAQTWLGHYPAGLSDVNRALEIARSGRDQNAEVMARAGLTFIQVLAGEFAQGIASGHEALAVAEKSGDTFFRYALNAWIAWGTFALGNARESLPYWAAAADVAKTLGGRLLLGELFAAVEAESLIGAVDPATGLRRAQEALALSQETESMIGVALAERAIGRAIAAGGEGQQEALPHIEKSLDICENIGARFEIVRGLLAKGEAFLACGNRVEATSALTQAQAMARECELEREESVAQALMARIDRATP
jgi:class 3 adenylate cyclase/tetratricopeptide (TPR) repeat protein